MIIKNIQKVRKIEYKKTKKVLAEVFIMLLNKCGAKLLKKIVRNQKQGDIKC